MFIKFKDGGRDFEYCDCRGLIGLILREEFGIEIPDAKVSCLSPLSVNRAIRDNNNWHRIDKPVVPSVILFCPDEAGVISHMGLYIGCGDFIHISSKLKTPCISSLANKFWNTVMEGIYAP